jgi:hypothetical protein
MINVLFDSGQITVFYRRKDIPPAWFYFIAWLIPVSPKKSFFIIKNDCHGTSAH